MAMLDRNHPPPYSRTRLASWSQALWLQRIGGGLLAALLVLCGACSLIVESKTDQCETDADCAKFGEHPFCKDGVCVASGLGPPGCFYGDPSSADQFLNQCTTAECMKFDNCARLGLCNGAKLPDLVPAPTP